jgi:hypothetical protein
LRYADGGLEQGALWFDDLRFVKRSAYLPPTSATVIAEELDINLYPNPANNRVTVEAGETINNASIYSMSGRMIYNQSFNATKVEIDLAQFKQGLYLVKIETEKGSYTQKLNVVK